MFCLEVLWIIFQIALNNVHVLFEGIYLLIWNATVNMKQFAAISQLLVHYLLYSQLLHGVACNAITEILNVILLRNFNDINERQKT
jgi:hypothetical protein